MAFNFQGFYRKVLPNQLLSESWIDLWAILLYTIVTIAVICLPVLDTTVLRTALGASFLLFVPGYALVAALFPKKHSIAGIERLALSFGMSMVAVPLISMVLAMTPPGFSLLSLTAALSLFIILCLEITIARRRHLPIEERFSIDLGMALESLKAEAGMGRPVMEKVLAGLVVLSLLISAGMVAYVIILPKSGNHYTEFYLLGPGGKAEGYPVDFHSGESLPVLVGIVNHEATGTHYDLLVTLNHSNRVTTLYDGNITLADSQRWENSIAIRPDQIGTHMDLEFLLYANGNMSSPYRECRLWINVTSPENTTAAP